MKNFIMRHKAICTAIAVAVIVIIILSLRSCSKQNDEYTIVLNGDAVVTVYQGTQYEDEGYHFVNENGEQVSNDVQKELEKEVVIHNDVNTSNTGEYTVSYQYKEQEVSRKVEVVVKADDTNGEETNNTGDGEETDGNKTPDDSQTPEDTQNPDDNKDTGDNSEDTIKPAYDMSGVTFNSASFTYDGVKHYIYVTGTLPEGVTVSYKNNGKTDSGVYEVIAHFTGDDKHAEISDMKANLVINKASVDMSKVVFSDQTFKYDGEAHSLEVDTTTLPDGVTILRYEGNGKTEPGEYTVKVYFKTSSNYVTPSPMTATLTILKNDPNKEDYDMSQIKFEDKTFVYDGKAHSLSISGTLPKGVTVSYTNNGKVDAGVYQVTATFRGDAAHNPIAPMTAYLTITKADYNMSAVSFKSQEFVYDGKSHSIYISGTLPSGVSVDHYENNGQINVGVYSVKVYFKNSNSNYNTPSAMSATLTISQGEKPEYDMSKVKFSNASFTYDGTSKSIFISGTLPAGVSVSYEGNGKVNAGSYVVTAHFKGDSAHKPIGDMTAILTINRADYNMSGVRFNSQTFTYDGYTHSIYITGTLPTGVSVDRYENNGQTRVGSYTVKVYFKNSNSNYNTPAAMSATLTIKNAEPIEKPSYDMSNISFDSRSFEYDGTPKSLYISGTLPAGVSVRYENNGKTSVGSYTVRAVFTGSSDYKEIPSKTATLTITKGNINMSGVSFNSETIPYDGSTHSIYISGSLPLTGMKVTYTGNGVSAVGKHWVTASFSGYDTNSYNLVSDMKAYIEITQAAYDMSGISFNDGHFTYDGSAHSISISGSLPSGVNVTYDGNGVTNAGGPYTVTAKFKGDSNHAAIPDMVAYIYIDKATISMSGVSFENKTFAFDGKSHSIYVSGSVPSNVNVTYKNNGRLEIGSSTVTAVFTPKDPTNYECVPGELTAVITIDALGGGGENPGNGEGGDTNTNNDGTEQPGTTGGGDTSKNLLGEQGKGEQPGNVGGGDTKKGNTNTEKPGETGGGDTSKGNTNTEKPGENGGGDTSKGNTNTEKPGDNGGGDTSKGDTNTEKPGETGGGDTSKGNTGTENQGDTSNGNTNGDPLSDIFGNLGGTENPGSIGGGDTNATGKDVTDSQKGQAEADTSGDTKKTSEEDATTKVEDGGTFNLNDLFGVPGSGETPGTNAGVDTLNAEAQSGESVPEGDTPPAEENEVAYVDTGDDESTEDSDDDTSEESAEDSNTNLNSNDSEEQTSSTDF